MSNKSKEKIKIYVDKNKDGRGIPRPRVHRLDGPFCIWPDGSKLYAVHGVYVPEWVIMEKEKITVESIDTESNAEVRRVLMNFFGVEKYLVSGNYEVLDEDMDQFNRPRRLLRKKVQDDEDIVRVEVTNSSPELDNSYRKYYLPVHPQLKPLLNTLEETEQSNAQKMTCHNAVASTFGKYGHEYGIAGQFRQGDVFIEFKDGSNKKGFQES